MKKILTYTLITTMISCFSYVNPSFADTQIKNENVIKLELKGTNTFNLAYNNDQLFLANNISSATSEIDCSGKQIMYSIGGGIVGVIIGAVLGGFIGLIIDSKIPSGDSRTISMRSTLLFGLPIGVLVGGLFGAFKGNEFAINECIANKNKVSLNKNNDFNVALFSKDF